MDVRPPPFPAFRPLRFLKDLVPIAAALAVVLVARTSFADHYIVPSGSMEPTVEVGDRILIDKLAFGLRVPLLEKYALQFSPPRAGDVVVLASPEDGITLLKRVVAVPGDRVRVVDGHVERNGEPVKLERATDGGHDDEWLGTAPHALRLDFGGGPDFGPVTVPDDKYLVMGDNRGNSHDGRSFGFVSRDAIRGRAARVFMRHGAMTWNRL